MNINKLYTIIIATVVVLSFSACSLMVNAPIDSEANIPTERIPVVSPHTSPISDHITPNQQEVGNNATDTQSLPSDRPNHISYIISDNLSIDADVLYQPYMSIPVLSVNDAEFCDIATMQQLLLSGKTMIYEYHDDMQNLLQAEDDSFVSLVRSSFNNFAMYSTLFSQQVNTCFHWRYDELQNNASAYKQTVDLPFASKDEISQKAMSDLQSFGINSENIGEFTFYILDHETLLAEEKILESYGFFDERQQPRGNWTAEDDCYLMVADYMINDVRVLDMSTMTASGLFLNESSIIVLYSARGIELLEIRSPYTATTQRASQDVIDVSVAIDTIVDKFDSIIMGSMSTVERIELRYIPQYSDMEHTQTVLIPAWCFYVDEKTPVPMSAEWSEERYIIPIDAYTGKEVI